VRWRLLEQHEAAQPGFVAPPAGNCAALGEKDGCRSSPPMRARIARLRRARSKNRIIVPIRSIVPSLGLRLCVEKIVPDVNIGQELAEASRAQRAMSPGNFANGC